MTLSEWRWSSVSDGAKYRDEEWLREQYVNEGRSTYDIADECGCSSTTVNRWLEKHAIKTRPSSGLPPDMLTDEGWLREQYVEEERSTRDIADECGCGSTTVKRWLKKHAIKTRPSSGLTPDMLTDEGWLREQYVEEERSIYDIADECGCGSSTISRWLKRHGIGTRSIEGEHNPRWNGGSQPYGLGWNASKRRAVRERDGYICQAPACSVTQDDHLDRYDERLHVHHLIKARDVDDPEERNAAENLITLCRDCHQRWERMAEAGIRPQIDGVTAD